MMVRGSGILLHLTSLPSRFGIGDLGPAAYDFLDFLARAGQRYWQILPLNPTDPAYDNDPYHAISAFALNPLLISPELLVEDGLVDAADLADAGPFPRDRVDFSEVMAFKEELFSRAFERFGRAGDRRAFDGFCKEQAWWLDDFALFCAIRSERRWAPWSEWPEGLKRREPAAIDEAREHLRDRVERARFLQFVAAGQWRRLREACLARGVRVIGDIPIYVDYDSADVWLHPEYFKLDEELRPTVVSGVPPDHFSEIGQLWSHPIYRWDTLRRDGFSWWVQRVGRCLALVDHLRIDHFRGLLAGWEVPAESETALVGRWETNPGPELLAALARSFPCLPIVAEDLGLITPDVRELMREYGIPGMRILLFAFEEAPDRNVHKPHNIVRDSVVYPGTHDNPPVRGWIEDEATEVHRARVREYFGREIAPAELPWEFIRLAMSTVADTAIASMQDVLGLGPEARMNLPGTREGNWGWRLASLPPPGVAERLRDATRVYERD